MARRKHLHSKPNTFAQTCLLAQTIPCSRAADHRLSGSIARLRSETPLVSMGQAKGGTLSRSIAVVLCNLRCLVRVTVALFIIAIGGPLDAFSQGITTSFHTTVAPKIGENVANPCEYDLRVLNPNKRIQALFVVFERGPELQHFYDESEVGVICSRKSLPFESGVLS